MLTPSDKGSSTDSRTPIKKKLTQITMSVKKTEGKNPVGTVLLG